VGLVQQSAYYAPTVMQEKVHIVTKLNLFSELYSIFETVHLGELVEPFYSPVFSF
jgi:hypothetical protein